MCLLQTVGGRPMIPNLAGLTLQQRQAILAQQRFIVTSDARRMLVRPPTSGIILPPGRVLLTSNGPASLVPGVAGRPGSGAAVTTSSGMMLAVAPTAGTHRPEKRKYDALRSVTICIYLIMLYCFEDSDNHFGLWCLKPLLMQKS